MNVFRSSFSSPNHRFAVNLKRNFLWEILIFLIGTYVYCSSPFSIRMVLRNHCCSFPFPSCPILIFLIYLNEIFSTDFPHQSAFTLPTLTASTSHSTVLSLSNFASKPSLFVLNGKLAVVSSSP